MLDGEAVILSVDGVSDFNALHSGKHDAEVQFCAFDILAEGGDDLRKLSLHLRKTNLERLLARRPEGIFVKPFERGEIGSTSSAPPAEWILKGWSQSTATGATRAVEILGQGKEPHASGHAARALRACATSYIGTK